MASTALDIANGALLRLGADPISLMSEATDRARLCNKFYDDTRRETLRAHPWNFALKRVQLDARQPVSASASGTSGSITVTATGNVFVAEDEGYVIADGAGGLARINTYLAANQVIATVEGNPLVSTNFVAGAWSIIPAFQWGYRYAKPALYLRVVEVQMVGRGQLSTIWSWWQNASNRPEPVKVEDQYLVTDIGPLMNIQFIRDIEDVSKWDAAFVVAMETHLAFKIAYGVTGSQGAAKTQFDAYQISLREARTADGQEGTGDDIYPDDLVSVRQ